MPEFNKIKAQLIKKCQIKDGIFVYLPELSVWQKKEIDFHDTICSLEEESHQLHSWRNFYYHRYFQDYLLALGKNAILLEIGAGNGYDGLALLKNGARLIESDISLTSIKAIKDKAQKQSLDNEQQIIYLVADGAALPLPTHSVDAVFLVAAFHHFEKQDEVLREIVRVLKVDGLLVMGMEPSRFMMGFTKLFVNLKVLRNVNGSSSTADDHHKGYGAQDFYNLTERYDFRLLDLKRVWFLLGFWHYGSEAIFRLFKLKKRLKLPLVAEKTLRIIDEWLLKIPVLWKFNWHFIAVFKKN